MLPVEQVANDIVFSAGVRIMQAAAEAQKAKNIKLLSDRGVLW